MPAPIGNANAAAQPRFPTHHNARGPELEHFLTVEAVFSTIQQLDTLPPHVTRLPQVEMLFPNCSNVWGPEWSRFLPVEAVSSTTQQIRFPCADNSPPTISVPIPDASRWFRIDFNQLVERVIPGWVIQQQLMPLKVKSWKESWHHLAAVFNPDDSLTEYAAALVAGLPRKSDSLACAASFTCTSKITFPQILALVQWRKTCALEVPGRVREERRMQYMSELTHFNQKHGLDQPKSFRVRQDGTLTSLGIIEGYRFLGKEFVDFEPRHLAHYVNQKKRFQKDYSELELFKEFGVSPVGARSFVTFDGYFNPIYSKRGEYLIRTIGTNRAATNHDRAGR